MELINVDDTIRQVHGYQKQGGAHGCSGVKGVNARLTALSSPPVIAAARLREGNTISGHGAARPTTQGSSPTSSSSEFFLPKALAL